MRGFLLSTILFISQSTYAGEIANIYQDGAFGTKWGDTINEVKKVFPAGKREAYKEVVMYVTRDGRPLFNVERKRNAFITFGFNPEQKLNSVAVEFQIQDYGVLLKNLDAKFGNHIMQSDNSSARIATWPIDNNIQLSLTMARAGFFSQEVKTSLNIIYTCSGKRD